jgi:hypothetical protein
LVGACSNQPSASWPAGDGGNGAGVRSEVTPVDESLPNSTRIGTPSDSLRNLGADAREIGLSFLSDESVTLTPADS